MLIDDNRLLENGISELKRIIDDNWWQQTFENELSELKRIIDDNWWQLMTTDF